MQLSSRNKNLPSLVIIGAGGFAREVAWLIEELNRASNSSLHLYGMIGEANSHIQPLGDDAWAFAHLPAGTHFVVAIGDPGLRKRLAIQYQNHGFQSVALEHPGVQHSHSVRIGQGSILCAGTTLTTDIQIGEHVIINLHCTIGHDSIIGDYSTLAPGVHVSGGVKIGQSCEIGTGAVILPGIRIGDQCRIGAGAVVTKDLDSNKTYMGVPARAVSP